jgi:hypothetical protein
VTVRLILDVSALLGYANTDTALAVGELIREVRDTDPNDHIGIPASALLTAYATTDDAGRASLSNIAADVELARSRQDPGQSAFLVLPLTSTEVMESADLEVNWPGRGHAIVEALRHNAVLATFQPCQDASPRLDMVDLGAGWTDDDPDGWEITDHD